MSISKYNAERYYDPTVYEALTNIEKEMDKRDKMVFICSPFGGDVETNTLRAKRYGRFAVNQKVTPIIPHLMYPQFLNEHDIHERQIGLDMGLVLLSKCQEMWVFGEYISSGMSVEIKLACQLNIPVRHFTIKCQEIVGGRK